MIEMTEPLENDVAPGNGGGRVTDPYVALARASLETYILTGTKLESEGLPEGLPDEMLKDRAGTFVSIHEHGDLRGCIGTLGPTCKNIALEICQNARSASTEDPRFPAISARELPDLEISVDVLGPMETISSPDELDVKRYGVVVSKGYRRGLLLPNLEGVDTVDYQIAIAKRKAGIYPEEDVKLQRFEVVRHT